MLMKYRPVPSSGMDTGLMMLNFLELLLFICIYLHFAKDNKTSLHGFVWSETGVALSGKAKAAGAAYTCGADASLVQSRIGAL